MEIKALMSMAMAVSSQSKCPSHKVGTIIFKDGRPLVSGVNGTREKGVNPDEYAVSQGWAVRVGKQVRLFPVHEDKYSAWANDNVVHSEMNAILYAARAGLSVEGATLVTTLSPCNNCAKHIAAAKIKKVVYHTRYSKSKDGWEKALTDQGIIVEQCNDLIDVLNCEVRVERT